MFDTLDGQCIDTLRFLAADMVQNANSGWPDAARSADGLRAVGRRPEQRVDGFCRQTGTMTGNEFIGRVKKFGALRGVAVLSASLGKQSHRALHRGAVPTNAAPIKWPRTSGDSLSAPIA